MKKLIVCISLALGLAFSGLVLAQGTYSPRGYWLQISDKTNKPRSIMQLDVDKKTQTYTGMVIYGFPVNGAYPNGVCTNCPGDLKGKKVLNLPIMWGFKRERKGRDVFSGGKIVDPDSGKTYRCKLSFEQGGALMKVRGYIGIPLLGRTQVWRRLNTKAKDAYIAQGDARLAKTN